MTADTPSSVAFPAGPAALLHWRDEVDSTLDEAWRLYRQNLLPPWGTLLAGCQSRGRGRMGRVWRSPPGHLYAALRLPEEEAFQAPAGAIRLAGLLALALEDLGRPVKLKWPNDLLRGGRKAGGILLENRQALVAGIGFNLGCPPEGIEREPGAPPAGAFSFPEPPQALWPMILARAYEHYRKFPPPERPARLLDAAARRLAWLGKRVLVKNALVGAGAAAGGKDFRGRIAGLGDGGALRLVSDQLGGPLVEIWSGSIFLLERQAGYDK